MDLDFSSRAVIVVIVLLSQTPTTNTTETTANERRGSVVDMLRELLAEGRNSEVLAVVSKLVARNSELERRLAQMLARLADGHQQQVLGERPHLRRLQARGRLQVGGPLLPAGACLLRFATRSVLAVVGIFDFEGVLVGEQLLP